MSYHNHTKRGRVSGGVERVMARRQKSECVCDRQGPEGTVTLKQGKAGRKEWCQES